MNKQSVTNQELLYFKEKTWPDT